MKTNNNQAKAGKLQSLNLEDLKASYSSKSAGEIAEDPLSELLKAKHVFSYDLYNNLLDDSREPRGAQTKDSDNWRGKLIDRYLPALVEEARLSGISEADSIDLSNKDYYDVGKNNFNDSVKGLLENLEKQAYMEHDHNLYTASVIKDLPNMSSKSELEDSFNQKFEKFNAHKINQQNKDFDRASFSYINLDDPNRNFLNLEKHTMTDLVNSAPENNAQEQQGLEGDAISETSSISSNISEPSNFSNSELGSSPTAGDAFSELGKSLKVGDLPVESGLAAKLPEMPAEQKAKFAKMSDQSWIGNILIAASKKSMIDSSGQENLIFSGNHSLNIVDIDGRRYGVISESLADGNKFQETEKQELNSDISVIVDLQNTSPNQAKFSSQKPSDIEVLYNDWNGESSFNLNQKDMEERQAKHSLPKKHINQINDEVILPQKLAKSVNNYLNDLPINASRQEIAGKLEESRQSLSQVINHNINDNKQLNKANFRQILKTNLEGFLDTDGAEKKLGNLVESRGNINTELASYYLTKAALDKDPSLTQKATTRLVGLNEKTPLSEVGKSNGLLSSEGLEAYNKALEEFSEINYDKLKHQDKYGNRRRLKQELGQILKPLTSWYNREKVDKEINKFLVKARGAAYRAEAQAEKHLNSKDEGWEIRPAEPANLGKEALDTSKPGRGRPDRESILKRFKDAIKKPIRNLVEKFTGKEKAVKEKLDNSLQKFEDKLASDEKTLAANHDKIAASSSKAAGASYAEVGPRISEELKQARSRKLEDKPAKEVSKENSKGSRQAGSSWRDISNNTAAREPGRSGGL